MTHSKTPAKTPERHVVPYGEDREGRERLDVILIELRTLAERIDGLRTVRETHLEEPRVGGRREALRIPDLCNPLPFYARGTLKEDGFNPVSAGSMASGN